MTPDPEVAKLQAQIAEGRLADTCARVTDAAMHLRQACDMLVEVDTTPDVSEAARAMDRAATVLLQFLEMHAKGS